MNNNPPKPLYIGSVLVDPPVLQAPMAGYTDWAYRQIVRRCGGVGLPAAEMISARGFVQLESRDRRYPYRLWGVEEEPRPLAVQIWDNDPSLLATVGAMLVEKFRVSVVDINFGCPVAAVTTKARSGSYLLGDPDRIGEIVSRVVEACRPVPVTAKIRLGRTRDTINAIEVAQAVEAAGSAAITVHGRTAADLFRGSADWDQIAQIKPHLKSMPLIGNGDLRTPEQVREVFARYAIDGVMIGRAALSKPWLFRQIAASLRGEPTVADPSLQEQQELLLAHHQLLVECFGERKGTILARKIACCYAQGEHGARQFRSRITGACTDKDFHALVGQFFPRQKEAD